MKNKSNNVATMSKMHVNTVTKKEDPMFNQEKTKSDNGSTPVAPTMRTSGIPTPAPSRTIVIKRPLVQFVKVAGTSFLTLLALLVIRHFCPEIAEQLSPVYTLIDEVALPVINWVCQCCVKGVNFLMEQEFFQKLIDSCAKFVA